jgi:hypothetical protein
LVNLANIDGFWKQDSTRRGHNPAERVRGQDESINKLLYVLKKHGVITPLGTEY